MATGASMVGKHIDVGRPVTYQSESLVACYYDKAVRGYYASHWR